MNTNQATMPAIFIGHGNPMNIIRETSWRQSWIRLGAALPRPKAILAVSAHWYVSETMVTATASPRTIHDFGGFPQELYEINYPAPGNPALAGRVREMLAPLSVKMDEEWGLDHGTWSVLYHMFPKADIPVIQLSIDRTKPPSFHYQIGKLLAPLREEGVLILGSGNLVHSFRFYKWDEQDAEVYDWALRFEQKVQGLLQAGKEEQLVDYQAMGTEAMLSIPTPDHYLPFLYIVGARRKGESVSYPVEGFDGGSMSMIAIQLDGRFLYSSL